MTEEDLYFTDQEMKSLTRDQLLKILDYLQIVYDPKYNKARLISLLDNYQISRRTVRLSLEETPETPRYSVRVRAIMERMEKEKNGP